jgi:hypothetical protein
MDCVCGITENRGERPETRRYSPDSKSTLTIESVSSFPKAPYQLLFTFLIPLRFNRDGQF